MKRKSQTPNKIKKKKAHNSNNNKNKKRKTHINKATRRNIYSSVVKDISFLLKNLKIIMIKNFAKNINLMRFTKNNKSQENLKPQVKRIIYSKIVQLSKIVI